MVTARSNGFIAPCIPTRATTARRRAFEPQFAPLDPRFPRADRGAPAGTVAIVGVVPKRTRWSARRAEARAIVAVTSR
jgi:hypothetical protein